MAAPIAAAQQHIGQRAAQELLGFDLSRFFIGEVPNSGTGHIAQGVAMVAQAV